MSHPTQQGNGLSVQERLNNYKPTELRADLSHLTDGDKRALVKLADVSDLLSAVYYKQTWSGSTQLREQLKNDAATGVDGAHDSYKLFEMFRGPWDRSMDNEPFIAGTGPKPKSAGVYPEDMTVAEFDSWVETLSAEDKKRAHGFYDIIQRDNGKLCLVAYAQAYQALLQPAAKLMREAADLQRTSAKAFFESMVHVRDFKGSQELDKFTSCLELVEKHLPIPDEYHNTKLAPPPIVVVNKVYTGGDAAVPMIAANNLPNNEEAIEIGGSKLTLIKNVQEAHSNGPHKVKGTNDTVRSRLQELYSAFEEAKSDITGLFAANLLVEDGTIDNITMRQFYTTYLASAFRSIRFGLTEAHGLGQAMQLNYLLEKGGFTYSKADGKFGVDMDKITQAVSDLTRDIMLIQGDGDKQRAVEFKDKYGNISAPVKAALDSMKSVPIDIAPIWVDINNLRAT
ncbi:hypothetical protein COEREDRAFT_8995 [Coemansia reversa NRRL 1564]|uniref:Uncharacterized protein n=1 Tax=Coemansia reversa (strain ATCC 12441 / NRRL 1564) TaxID=763665 RepID=A0A2G5B9R5_COERN|nr:hypothetical protein COEREDRAFT_8995 [Coemansia reversa NRRL 1564]|eukprot:PIA15753.1 hypothetical protein COEREDRAFT_8995 [Coemansia reversa NRRL 1564]